MSDEPSALLQLGAIGAPFGVRGWVKVRSDTQPREALLEYRRWKLHIQNEIREFTIQTSGRSAGQLTVKFLGVDDRDAAIGLRGSAVFVPREQMQKPAGKEFYRSDLIGCDVETTQGHKLGKVQHFVETPAHALMVVLGEAEVWVPAVPDHIRRVDLSARKVIIDWEPIVV